MINYVKALINSMNEEKLTVTDRPSHYKLHSFAKAIYFFQGFGYDVEVTEGKLSIIEAKAFFMGKFPVRVFNDQVYDLSIEI